MTQITSIITGAFVKLVCLVGYLCSEYLFLSNIAFLFIQNSTYTYLFQLYRDSVWFLRSFSCASFLYSSIKLHFYSSISIAIDEVIYILSYACTYSSVSPNSREAFRYFISAQGCHQFPLKILQFLFRDKETSSLFQTDQKFSPLDHTVRRADSLSLERSDIGEESRLSSRQIDPRIPGIRSSSSCERRIAVRMIFRINRVSYCESSSSSSIVLSRASHSSSFVPQRSIASSFKFKRT